MTKNIIRTEDALYERMQLSGEREMGDTVVWILSVGPQFQTCLFMHPLKQLHF